MEELHEALCTIGVLAVLAAVTALCYRLNPTFRAWADGEMEEEK